MATILITGILGILHKNPRGETFPRIWPLPSLFLNGRQRTRGFVYFATKILYLMRMQSSAITPSVELSSYRDQHFKGSRGEQERLLRISSTIYVGNLAFYTTEEQIYELFAKCGDVKRIIMGLDKYRKTPCGFCFVEYYQRADAENCMRYINGTRLDDRIIRTDWDAGFVEGRQYGRGKTGGQVRDEYRTDYDGGRGGYGKIVQQKAVGMMGMEPPSAPFK